MHDTASKTCRSHILSKGCSSSTFDPRGQLYGQEHYPGEDKGKKCKNKRKLIYLNEGVRRILPSLWARVCVWISKDVSSRLLAEECESPGSARTLVCCSQARDQPQTSSSSSEDKQTSINNHLSGPGKSPQEHRRKDHLSISSRLQEDRSRFWGLRNTQTSFHISPSLLSIPSPLPLKGNTANSISLMSPFYA